jgi:hypothetical protein
MAVLKPSAKSTETVEYLEALLRETDHFGALVEQFAAAQKGSEMYASQVSRQLAQLRQKAMMRNLGFIADAAGQLSVMASRGGSPMMKGRMLRDGVVSFRALIQRTIRATVTADESVQKEKAHVKEKAAKVQSEAIKARILAEEAKEAARLGTGPVAKAAAGAGSPPAAAPPAASAPGRPAVAPPVATPAAAPAIGGTPAAAPKPGPAGAVPAPSLVNPPAGPRFAARPSVAKPAAPPTRPGPAPASSRPASTPPPQAPTVPPQPAATERAPTKPRDS